MIFLEKTFLDLHRLMLDKPRKKSERRRNFYNRVSENRNAAGTFTTGFRKIGTPPELLQQGFGKSERFCNFYNRVSENRKGSVTFTTGFRKIGRVL